ncbi:MAG: Ig-like domain-containing protein [Pseudomonadota bacterium]
MTNRTKYARLTALMALAFAGHASAANLAPTFTAIPAKTVAEGQTLTFTVAATDPEGTAVTITAKGLKTWMTFKNNVLTATPSLSNSGSYSVSFTAKDTSGKATTLAVPITVTNVNQAPTINALTSRTVAEGGSLSWGITATDADKDVVTLTASPLKSWMKLVGTTFTATPGYSDAGTHTVTITASDGKLSTSAVQTITVTDVNQAPVFGAFGSFTVAEGSTLNSTVTATDPDGSPVTITASGMQAAWMSFDGSKFSATPDHSKAGSYSVTFTASDGAKQTKSTVTLVVNDTNRAPVLNPVGAWRVGEGRALSLPISGSDEDGDALTVTATGLQSWMSFDGRTFRARPGTGKHGSYNVTFKVSDGKTTDSETSNITVTLDDSAFPRPWNEYWSSQWTGASWATMERSWFGYLTGINLLDNTGKVNSLATEVGNRIQSRDQIVTIAGFGGDSDQEMTTMGDLFDLLRAGGLATWQSVVMAQVDALSPLDPDADKLIYQLGNEITKQNFSDTLRAWAASRGITVPGSSQEYDQEMIPYYVEYYLAPTVEAIRQSSLNFYGDEQAVTVALGSIGNGGNAGARAFIDALLDYQVDGTYAPSLAGKKVTDLVHLLTVHYPGSSSNLDLIWDKWRGVGTLRGLWVTETVGIRAAEAGQGAAVATSELGNHLAWHYHRGMGPDETRVSIYGWDTGNGVAGTAPDEAMKTFHSFFGNAALEVEANYATVTGSASDLETTQFSSVDDGARRVVTVTAASGQVVSASLQSMTFNKDGWTGSVTATMHRFSPAGHVVSTPSVTENATSYTVTLSPAITLSGDGEAVMITLLKN